MRIALTYDLRDDYRALGFADEELAEFDFIGTIDAIDAALRALGHETERVGNVRALALRLSEDARWDLVFNTAEGVRGFGREAQVPALLEAFEIAYTFSDPLVSALTLHKGMAKHVAIRMRDKAAVVRTLDPAKNQMGSGSEPMQIETDSHPKLHLAARSSRRKKPANARSSGRVILMLRSEPRITATGCPSRSTRLDSSVP